MTKAEMQKKMAAMNCTVEEAVIMIATESLNAWHRFMDAPTDSDEEAVTCEEHAVLREFLKEYVDTYA